MTTTGTDETARRKALDPRASFIVQAPAGSGKTELLIQRYLSLLATVREPEQIVAITFTRKAAAEMRNRIVAALQAASGAAGETQRPETLVLAQAALERDRARGWLLIEQPLRCRIDTLDALNAWLAQQLPVLAGGVSGADIVEDAAALYREAARRTLEELGRPGRVGQSLRVLAGHLDNALGRIEALLADLLPRRDQWLRHLAGTSGARLRAQLERALERLVAEELEQLDGLLLPEARVQLPALLEHAARYAADEAVRRACTDLAGVPAPRPARLRAWQALAGLLLTAEGQWRKQLTRAHGFGPQHAEPRARLRQLLDRLAPEDRLRAALAAVARLPEPRYSEAEWGILDALRMVLERLAAELRVLFAERGVVDFVELALGARQALGSVDAPSELLLALDERIQHILVDEFQDTSHSQLELLRLLTSGWQAGDGRTLFLVGDPMQSIYRFRDADVSLFLEVKERGVGDVRCEALTLERNFRSAPAVVEWGNTVFAAAFPQRDDLGAGAVRFHACIASRRPAGDQGVQVHALRTADMRAELARVMEILAEERSRAPQQSLAVLVQSRSHLTGLHEHLAARGWPAQAVEIDALDQRQLGQDLIGLTRALTHLADRVAWLGILRAPWCGLRWADLEALVEEAPERTVWELMHDEGRVGRLSPDGTARLCATRAALTRAYAARAELTLSRWVEHVWHGLDGPSCLDDPREEAHAEQFFAGLATLERRGDLDDPAILDKAFSRPAPQATPAPEASIEIMTIHRAKGLEFDTVVLLGLGRPPPPEMPRALYWMERLAQDGTEDLIMAPLARAGGRDALAQFVRRAEARRELAERARLLYVAATRARDRLHLVGHVSPGDEAPPPRSLLAPLWSALAPAFERAASNIGETQTPPRRLVQPLLRRLVGGPDHTSAAPPATPDSVTPRPRFEWAGEAAVHVGTVVHRHLQRLALLPETEREAARIHARAAVLARELRLLGVEEEELDGATRRAVEALVGALEDPIGQWLLRPHRSAESELRLTLDAGGKLEHARIDRTFIDEDGTRWIVDYKVSAHEGGDVRAFVDSEVERYRPQLERYASLIIGLEQRAVRLGLYFPLLPAFRSWQL